MKDSATPSARLEAMLGSLIIYSDATMLLLAAVCTTAAVVLMWPARDMRTPLVATYATVIGACGMAGVVFGTHVWIGLRADPDATMLDAGLIIPALAALGIVGAMLHVLRRFLTTHPMTHPSTTGIGAAAVGAYFTPVMFSLPLVLIPPTTHNSVGLDIVYDQLVPYVYWGSVALSAALMIWSCTLPRMHSTPDASTVRRRSKKRNSL